MLRGCVSADIRPFQREVGERGGEECGKKGEMYRIDRKSNSKITTYCTYKYSCALHGITYLCCPVE